MSQSLIRERWLPEVLFYDSSATLMLENAQHIAITPQYSALWTVCTGPGAEASYDSHHQIAHRDLEHDPITGYQR